MDRQKDVDDLENEKKRLREEAEEMDRKRKVEEEERRLANIEDQKKT